MVVWYFKGEEGNSHEGGKQMFVKQMFSGPETMGHREEF